MDPANVLMLRRVVQYTKQKAIPPFKILINANNLYACMRRFISKSKKETVVLSFTKDKDQNIELNFKAEYGHFRIKSLPDYGDQREQKIPELKSLKFYYMDYISLPISHEHLADKIFNDVKKCNRTKTYQTNIKDYCKRWNLYRYSIGKRLNY